MKHNNCYMYPKSMRETIEGKRHYAIKHEKLPSVTTILSATQDPEKTASLKAWRTRMGEDTATRIVDEAAARGTATVGQQAHNMAVRIIEQGLVNLTEYYGLECTLFYPGLYAGATDLVGLHKGQIAIIDFKQTNKPKKEEWIGDYKLQLAAYALAHNYMHRTNIKKAVIMMCSKDNYYQEFVMEGAEMKKYMHKWLGRVSQYYEQKELNNIADRNGF